MRAESLIAQLGMARASSILASFSRPNPHRMDLLTAVRESRNEAAEEEPNNGQARRVPSTVASQHGSATSTIDFLALTANRAVFQLNNRNLNQAHFRAFPYATLENDADTGADHRQCPLSTVGPPVIKHEARPKKQARRRDGISACAPLVVTAVAAVTADSIFPCAPGALTSATTASSNPEQCQLTAPAPGQENQAGTTGWEDRSYNRSASTLRFTTHSRARKLPALAGLCRVLHTVGTARLQFHPRHRTRHTLRSSPIADLGRSGRIH
jgi:hypothetical protein